MRDYYKTSIQKSDQPLDNNHNYQYSYKVIGRGVLSGLYKLDTAYYCDYIGNIELLLGNCLAIIGSRDVNKEDQLRVWRLVKSIKKWIEYHEDKINLNIVSGLAKGIDTFAHQFALKNTIKTVAVIPTNINDCYPKENLNLKKDIIKDDGLILSCFPQDSDLLKDNFIKRNKLIALLSEVIFLVAADEYSGTRHVVKEAIELDRTIVVLMSLYDKKIPWIDSLFNSKANVKILGNEEDFYRIMKVFTKNQEE